MGEETDLLRAYLDARDGPEEETALASLLFEVASPVVRKTVTRRLLTAPEQDREDVAGDVILDLVARLQDLKRSGEMPIERFAAYVAVATHNGCDQYLRHRYPQRHRLKNRLRYLLAKSTAFDLWEDPERGWICGRRHWCDRPLVPLDPEIVARLGSPGAPPQSSLAHLFDCTGGPVEFDALTGIFALFWGIRDSVSSLDTVEHAASTPDPAADALLAQKQDLDTLWSEIEQLPPAQRTALLLNLRDTSGGSMLWMLPAAGVANVRRIAELVGIAAAELAEMWGRLPLSDLDIAARLGVARQQVINLRQAARQRLGRRLRTDGTSVVQKRPPGT